MVGRLYIDPVAGQYLSNPEYYGGKHAEIALPPTAPRSRSGRVWFPMNDTEAARRWPAERLRPDPAAREEVGRLQPRGG
jgi:hypothetical protein